MKKGICIIVLIALLFVTTLDSTEIVWASEDEKIGIVTTTSLNIRNGPGTQFSPIGYLTLNKEVIVLGEEISTDGEKWYEILYNELRGFVSAEFIVIQDEIEYVYDKAFEKHLDTQGFPDTYKDYLRYLHVKYPNWKFLGAKTGLSWEDVVKKETKVGTTLVTSSAPISWKSKEVGAYDEETQSYISYDSGGWVTASEDLVKYYLDPRNFINQVGVFQFITHSFDEQTQSIDGLQRMLKGTFMEGDFPETQYHTYADVLMEAGKNANVNPYVLAAMIIQEQGVNGTGKCIAGTNEDYPGVYNYFNIGAYRTEKMSAITRGLWYASQEGNYQRPWDSRYKSIIGGAIFYGTEYVGKNKNNLYFKKWNVMNGLSNVGIGQYMTNVQGAEGESVALRKAYYDLLDAPMTFVIPIYDNMPKEACEKPGTENLEKTVPLVIKQAQTIKTNVNEISCKITDSFFVLEATSSGGGRLTFASSDEDIATVDNTGLVTIMTKTGTAKITITAEATDKYGEATKEIAIKVRELNTTELAEIEKKKQEIISGVEKTKVVCLKVVTAEEGKVKLTWKKSNSGYKVDHYQVWRSTKKSSGYKKIFTSTEATKKYFVNTKDIYSGDTYWYKVRGVRVVDGKKAYTPFTKIKVKIS